MNLIDRWNAMPDGVPAASPNSFMHRRTDRLSGPAQPLAAIHYPKQFVRQRPLQLKRFFDRRG